LNGPRLHGVHGDTLGRMCCSILLRGSGGEPVVAPPFPRPGPGALALQPELQRRERDRGLSAARPLREAGPRQSLSRKVAVVGVARSQLTPTKIGWPEPAMNGQIDVSPVCVAYVLRCCSSKVVEGGMSSPNSGQSARVG
jgi:hypothetical protein